MSTMPRYYGDFYGGGFTPRPVTFVVAGAVGFMFYRAGTHAQCSYSSYAYGHAFREYSDWICPMGQYRVSFRVLLDRQIPHRNSITSWR